MGIIQLKLYKYNLFTIITSFNVSRGLRMLKIMMIMIIIKQQEGEEEYTCCMQAMIDNTTTADLLNLLWPYFGKAVFVWTYLCCTL